MRQEHQRRSASFDPQIRGANTDDIISILAVGTCLVALVACAVAHYLAAFV